MLVNNNSCYPNTISEALSLLVIFNMNPANKTDDAAIVSYHEKSDSNGDDINIDIDDSDQFDQQPVIIEVNDNNQANNTSKNEEVHHGIFDATVMASVIAEATAYVDEDQFLGPSFAQLQEVDAVYEDNEPDLVCCAHIVDMANDNDNDVPYFVLDANIKAGEHNEMVWTRTATITRHENFLNDFKLMIYHTAHRVMHKSSRKVGIFHYESKCPELISHTYGPNVAELIVDYSDVLRFNSFHVMAVNKRPTFGVIFLKGHISLKIDPKEFY
jgi:hypothetical protein